jgi:hypothetical protein
MREAAWIVPDTTLGWIVGVWGPFGVVVISRCCLQGTLCALLDVVCGTHDFSVRHLQSSPTNRAASVPQTW